VTDLFFAIARALIKGGRIFLRFALLFATLGA
jgi:hypothetical protein